MQNNELDKLIQTLAAWASGKKPQAAVDLPGVVVNEPGVSSEQSSAPVESALTNLLRVTQATAAPPVVQLRPEQNATDSQPSQPADHKQESEEIARLNAQLEQLRRVAASQAEAIADNTKALSTASSSKSQSTSAEEGVGSKIFSTLLKSGLGVGSLVSGIVGLFGGGTTQTVEALPTYSLPPSTRLEAGVTTAGQIAPAQHSQTGAPRADAAPASQVIVQIQALDSRSVLDRSDDIARAVREAMLHSHSLNDVVNDL